MAETQRKFEVTPLQPMEYRESIQWSDQVNAKLRAKGLQQYIRQTAVLEDGKQAKARLDAQVQRMDDHTDYKSTVADLSETILELGEDDPDDELATKTEERKIVLDELRKMKWQGDLQEDGRKDSFERSYKLAKSEYNTIQEKAATLTMDLNQTISASLRTRMQSHPGYEDVVTSLQELTFLVNTTEKITMGPFAVVKRDLIDTADAITIPTTYVELQEVIMDIDKLHAETQKVAKRYGRKSSDIFTDFSEVIKMRINDHQLMMAKVKYEAMTEAQQQDWLHVSDSLTQLVNNEKIIERSLEKSVVIMANKVGIKANSMDQGAQCFKWQQGTCMAGDKCKYRHVGQEGVQSGLGAQKTACFKWPQGKCTRGNSCRFQHVGKAGVNTSNKQQGVCHHWDGRSCKFGPNCRFQHPPQPNKDYAEEECPYEKAGRECLDKKRCGYQHSIKRRKTGDQEEA